MAFYHSLTRIFADKVEDNDLFIVGKCNDSLMEIVKDYGPDYPIITLNRPKIILYKMEDLRVVDSEDAIIMSFQSILNIYSTSSYKNRVYLNDVYCYGTQVYVVIDSITQMEQEMAVTEQVQQTNDYSSLPHFKSDQSTDHVSQIKIQMNIIY